jgi:triacylglycerol lipase
VERLGGAARVQKAVLGGTPNHGVWADAAFRPNNEFNGAGLYLTALNAPKGPQGDEVTPGVAWMTVRSDSYDKFAQPEGTWIGLKGKPTNVSFEGPALKGATNVVLPGRDHREVSFHAEAVALTATFLGARVAGPSAIVPQVQVTLDGKVSGFTAAGPTNLPLAGARVQVYAVDRASGERRGTALIDKRIGADGRWGPLVTDSATALEFVLEAPGFAVTHIYRSPFPRSSDLVHLRPERLNAGDKDAAAVLVLSRPRGYFGLGRDQISFDGQSTPPDVPIGVPGVSTSRLRLKDGAGRAVAGEFNGEHIVARAWPAAEQHLSVLELHY